jgi:hypothetical protein
MRSLYLTLTLLTTYSALAHAADLEERRLYEATRAEKAPVIDGKLDDACWQKATATNTFSVLKGPEACQQTCFYVTYDAAQVYLGVVCYEKDPGHLQAAVQSDDQSTVMGDDAVELFLQPDLDAPEYYQFAANSLGTRYDGQAFDSTWNGEWQARASVGKEAWYLECAISFASFERFAVPGAVWGLQVARHRNAGGDTEWSSWPASPAGFHQPARFGRLVFGGQAGGADRALLIEIGRYARESIALEGRLNDLLGTVRQADAKAMGVADRKQLQAQIAAGDAALKALQDVLAQTSPLDTRAWLKTNAALKAAADGLDEAAWNARFSKLLADD